ncbi:MAG: uroporphyrinogen-III synthase, partial [Propionibacteriaceae bacterium]|nr:uroporphyrinogen-III synthase [Propionibacteriaceae bacterium]
ALVAAFPARLPARPGRVLAPGSALAAPTLADGLTRLGWTVERVATYTTGPLPAAPAALVADWPAYDAVVLTAGSVARAVHDLLGEPAGHTRLVALGEPTADAARATGLSVHAIAAAPDAAGVLAALVTALEEPA